LENVANTNEETIMASNFSALLVRGGYAEFVVIGKDSKYESVLRSAEILAIDDLLGIWEKQ
jgi:endonuclease YncB( thermonuclease family)